MFTFIDRTFKAATRTAGPMGHLQ